MSIIYNFCIQFMINILIESLICLHIMIFIFYNIIYIIIVKLLFNVFIVYLYTFTNYLSQLTTNNCVSYYLLLLKIALPLLSSKK